jgi:hypothetical protein
MRIREDFHRLIDGIKDEEVLKSYYELIHQLNQNLAGELWNKLSAEEKNEVLQSYDDSMSKENLISHSELKAKHKKWLEK